MWGIRRAAIDGASKNDDMIPGFMSQFIYLVYFDSCQKISKFKVEITPEKDDPLLFRE